MLSECLPVDNLGEIVPSLFLARDKLLTHAVYIAFCVKAERALSLTGHANVELVVCMDAMVARLALHL